jgi:hypothetical protein
MLVAEAKSAASLIKNLTTTSLLSTTGSARVSDIFEANQLLQSANVELLFSKQLIKSPNDSCAPYERMKVYKNVQSSSVAGFDGLISR